METMQIADTILLLPVGAFLLLVLACLILKEFQSEKEYRQYFPDEKALVKGVFYGDNQFNLQEIVDIVQAIILNEREIRAGGPRTLHLPNSNLRKAPVLDAVAIRKLVKYDLQTALMNGSLEISVRFKTKSSPQGVDQTETVLFILAKDK